jgi:type VII secretion-associated serine protease mycosin
MPGLARLLRRGAALLCSLTALLAACPPSAPAALLGGYSGCAFPAQQLTSPPWFLQRLLLDQMWRRTRGQGVRVAVIDTGVDDRNPQLTGAVDTGSGGDLIDPAGNGTDDTTGHGTEVAGIIAARPAAGTGFVGLAPRATIIPIRQNDERGDGTPASLASAVRRAVAAGASVINISQETADGADPQVAQAVQAALDADVVVVASAGNDGAVGVDRTTYPAAYPGVLAVGASDRRGEPAAFSQPGPFVGVLAPGVDMVSTVPLGGQCAVSGTSFSAPYAAAVAALLRAEHPGWRQSQVVARVEQTADRTGEGRDDDAGWGVVNPLRALADDAVPRDSPVPGRPAAPAGGAVQPAAVTPAGPPRQGQGTAAWVLGGAAVLLATAAGALVVAAGRARPRRSGSGAVSDPTGGRCS